MAENNTDEQNPGNSDVYKRQIVGSIFIFTDIREQTVIQLTDHRVENFFTSPAIIRRSQGHSRQSNKGIP